MKKSIFSCAHRLLLLSLLGLMGCYSTVEVGDGLTDKAIAIDWVDPPCAVPGSRAGYIEGNGFGAENVTIRVDGIEAEVIAATGMDASFIVPAQGLSPGEDIEVVVENPGGRLATIDWRVCEIECDPPDCDDGNECTTDVCDPVAEMCVHTPVGDGVACDFDGLPGVCIAGLCEEDLCAGVDCDDGDPCTTDSCDPADGLCGYVNICPDTDPPVLIDFDFIPKQIDVSTQSETVVCSMSLVDVGSAGVDRALCRMTSPDAELSQVCWVHSPSSGDRFDGVWTCSIDIGQGAPDGVWNAAVQVWDEVENYQLYNPEDLVSLGFPSQLDVVSQAPDTDPPVLTDFDFTPKQIDVSTQSETVVCSMSLVDVGSAGVDRALCRMTSPDAELSQVCWVHSPSSGDRFDGVWTCSIDIGQGAPDGVWNAAVQVWDEVENYQLYNPEDLVSLGFPSQLDVVSQAPDTDPPVLTDFDFTPKQIDVSTQSETVVCSMSLVDVGSAGVDRALCRMTSPDAELSQVCWVHSPSSGDRFDGVWTCSIDIGQGAPDGVWNAAVQVWDEVENYQLYNPEDLVSLGFPSQLDVTYGTDSTPPTVISVTPADGAVDVPFNTRTISVFFDEDMDRPSMLSSTYFTDSTGAVQSAGKAYYDDGVLLQVVNTLEPNETYYVHVTTDAMDLVGNHLEEEFVSSFTTGDAPVDSTPPTVRSVSPADGSVDVPFNTRTISVFFDEDMDRPSMLSSTYFTDSTGAVQSAGKAYYDDGVLLQVVNTLEPNETYYVHVTTDAMDLVGNHLEEEFVSSFTTGDAPVDSTPPTVRSVSPADGSVDVPFNTRTISVFFDEDMDRPSMLSSTYFTDSTGAVQSAGKAYYDDGVLLQVVNTLEPNETYYVHVTTDAMDLVGNHLEEEFVSSFTTGASSADPPIASSSDFSQKSVDVALPIAAASCGLGVSENPAAPGSGACD